MRSQHCWKLCAAKLLAGLWRSKHRQYPRSRVTMRSRGGTTRSPGPAAGTRLTRTRTALACRQRSSPVPKRSSFQRCRLRGWSTRARRPAPPSTGPGTAARRRLVCRPAPRHPEARLASWQGPTRSTAAPRGVRLCTSGATAMSARSTIRRSCSSPAASCRRCVAPSTALMMS